ncbi:MAG: hypothetical protein OXG58_10785 [Gemmatimonadetes bacterium]|nr:hypothetical protein [Gemmatimonadota bacterium]MCY3942354.1 hypothetical protein [Gemmatimonadota bacterium]
MASSGVTMVRPFRDRLRDQAPVEGVGVHRWQRHVVRGRALVKGQRLHPQPFAAAGDVAAGRQGERQPPEAVLDRDLPGR